MGNDLPAAFIKAFNESFDPLALCARTIWSDSIRPIFKAFTRTLCAAPSPAKTLVSAMPAARVTEVGAEPLAGVLARVLSILIILPQRLAFIDGRTKRLKRTAAMSLRSKSYCHSSSVMASKAPAFAKPALFTRISMRSKSVVTAWWSRLMSSASATSQT